MKLSANLFARFNSDSVLNEKYIWTNIFPQKVAGRKPVSSIHAKISIIAAELKTKESIPSVGIF